MTRLYDFLSRHRRIGLDTNIFIYEFAANPRYTPVTDPLFRQIGAGDHTIVTSTITLTELLVQPYRDNDGLQIRIIYSRIASDSAIEWVQPSAIIADTAARIRATHNPDNSLVVPTEALEALGLKPGDKLKVVVYGKELIVFEKPENLADSIRGRIPYPDDYLEKERQNWG